MREPSLELLFDLARLLRRYPPEAWNEAFLALRNPRVINRLIYFARKMSETSRDAHDLRRQPFRETSSREMEEDWEKGYLLSQLRSDLMRKPLGQIRDVAYSLRVGFDEDTKKSQLVSGIMQTLAGLGTGDLRKKLPRHLMETARNAGEYDRWVSLIMGKYAK